MFAATARILSSVPIIATLLPLGRTGRGWVRIWDFPRTQIAALGIAGLAALWRSGSRRPTDQALRVSLAACVLYQGWKIWPYTPLHPKQVLRGDGLNPDRQIRILIANIFMFNRRADLMLRNIREADPDVVLLLEPDEWWEDRMRPLEREYKYANKCPLDNTYGMLLYSRLELTETETRFRLHPDLPSMRTVVTLRSGDHVVLHAVHPMPPRPGTPSWGRDAELVLVGQEVDCERKPAIVIGDLNDVAWSYTTSLFQRLSQTLDPRVGRGMYNTFHAWYPLLRYPLDHAFHSREFRLVSLRRLPPAGSDHFPILVELEYHPPSAPVQEPPELTPDDHEQATEMLKDAEEHELPEPEP